MMIFTHLVYAATSTSQPGDLASQFLKLVLNFGIG